MLPVVGKKEQFQDLNLNFPQTFRYAGGSYQVVSRKTEYTEVPDSRYKAKQHRACMHSSLM